MAGDHERYENDIGAYLLGALPPLEAEVFERHLMGCDACREEMERLRPAVDALPRAVEPYEPPPTLKASIMEVVQAESREPPSRARAPGRPGWLAGLRLRPAVALAGVALLAGAALGFGLTSGSDDEDARTVAATVAPALPGATARVEIDGDAAVLRVARMPAPPRGKVYEVWVQKDGMVRPAGALFTVDRDGNGSAAIPGGVGGVSRVMVTREVARGAEVPTEQPVVEAEV